ncbi:protein SMAX1-LIKE 4-like [Salvia miltiorrhiza]|uniref:protein SMAX1-LIKE 4-like n=1 Tax=Salvia miltiorrhiza TaxID=226208 RepID=UPI0025AC985F|nr:protein SMAX1-LIKE 4-like [Salvia miltiorrhiza]
MRAGGCAAQQTLSAEAAAVLKHSLSLARRRGHAQVTPLHVAATLLTSRSSLLRRACLKSQPPHHPLQCRALELCFNVALNRLPASPGPLLHAQPSLSNALVAALKRAQAHQRRGCVEQQQQQPPLLALKVELEQLILSILDDPSVSRVMREAGFSSTAVKANLDDCTASVFHCYNPSASASGGIYSTPNSPPSARPLPDFLSHHDITRLLHIMTSARPRRNVVVVADTSSMAETLVAQLISLVEKGDVPDQLKAARLVKFQFSAVPLVLMNKDEVDMNVADLKRKVDSFAAVGRVIVYIGDLKWAVDHGAAVDHLIAEIGKLLAWYNASNMKVWLMATANYQTYVKCQIKQPPLDAQWALQAVSVPSAGLALTLNAATPTSGSDSRIAFSENSSPVSDRKVLCLKEETDHVLTCCQECTSDYQKEAALRSIHHKSFSDKEHLPYWLKPHANHTLDKEDLDELRRKYNKQCQHVHLVGRNECYTSTNPSWLNKGSVLGDTETISFSYPAVKAGASTLPRFRRQQSCHIEFSFSKQEPNLDSLKMMEDKEVKITLALGSSYIDEVKHEHEKRTALHHLLRENLPWQLEAVPAIVDALMSRDKFVVLDGNDNVAKRRAALAAAESILGSSDLLLSFNMRNTENREMLQRALRDHDGKLVALVEFADPQIIRFLAEANRDSVFILTTDEASSNDTSSVIQMKLVVQEPHHLDHKRRADWELGGALAKSRRNSNEMEEVSSNGHGLDLNIRADEGEAKLSPISSEITVEPPLTFIKNRVVLNMGPEQDREAREALLWEFKRAFDETSRNNSFNVEEKVLEQVLKGAGLYVNSLFGKWLKDIFQTSLNGINCGERDKVSVRLCLVGEREREGERDKDGFKGTCLPKRIPVSYIG